MSEEKIVSCFIPDMIGDREGGFHHLGTYTFVGYVGRNNNEVDVVPMSESTIFNSDHDILIAVCELNSKGEDLRYKVAKAPTI